MLNRLLGISENASEHGLHVDHMLEFCHWFMAILFVGWSCFFVYTLWRFHHKRSPRANYIGVKTKASTHLEISVVIVEAVLLLGFAIPLWGKRVNDFPVHNAVIVRVVGEQFLWNFQHPGRDGQFGRFDFRHSSGTNRLGLDEADPAAGDDIITMNSITLPVGQPIIMQVASKDVIHSVAIKAMRIAQDAIPGIEIPMWFTPIREGTYEIVCAQLCGASHYAMRGEINVVSQAEFNQWVEQNSTPPPDVDPEQPVEEVRDVEVVEDPEVGPVPVPDVLDPGHIPEDHTQQQ